MFKPTPCLNARLRLTTKMVNGGYYKGNRTGNVGFFGPKKGQYFIDWRKVRTYVVPESLSEFKLTPFITKKVEPPKNSLKKAMLAEGREVTGHVSYDGKFFLQQWYRENPEEVDRLMPTDNPEGEPTT
ncbi:hypothetical protein AJ80_03794 [Polytolypa hystricis UAMH7299]|uniref:50S ribosomal protein YmL27 n=1 Tax=Polytolypa hystricis (strain UAMH7299) TaxID=1447883 RepID=A0A2B7YF30_POLH7|nr:hypothetical protein AJ80_03794 [Polytolypa hystricis UAMH7299]